ncbi:MAG TPA: YceI family protein [Thermoanaerobaculia bacterium]|jgi:polyisoprenoid-binding protein YceI
MLSHRVVGILLASAAVSASARGEIRTIDPGQSTLTVHVGKSGMFSAFGDDHVIRAPIVSGKADDGSQPSVELLVDARQMTVLDPEFTPAKRAAVQKRMRGPEVLDVERFAEIRFRSTLVTPSGPGRWHVTGVLELHGRTAPLSFEVTTDGGRVRGAATVSQRAFGIEPISVAGGTVKVSDDVKIDFDVVTDGKGP